MALPHGVGGILCNGILLSGGGGKCDGGGGKCDGGGGRNDGASGW